MQRQAFRDSIPKPTYLEGPTNAFGLRRKYYALSFPQHDPEEVMQIEDLYDSENHQDLEDREAHRPASPGPSSTAHSNTPVSFAPFPNLSSFKLGEWFINGKDLTIQSLKTLAVDIAQTPGFSDDIRDTDWSKCLGLLAGSKEDLDGDDPGDWTDDADWKMTPVSITFPISGVNHSRVVSTLHHRSIVSIIQEKIANAKDIDLFHYDPFEVVWQPDPSVPPIRVHSELYNSDAFLKAHCEVQDAPPIRRCTRPRVVVGLMFWSDETHLTTFSSDKLWPCYMFFGNESKYRRCKPSLDLCHHVAYFEKVRTRLFRSFSYFANSTPSLLTTSKIL